MGQKGMGSLSQAPPWSQDSVVICSRIRSPLGPSSPSLKFPQRNFRAQAATPGGPPALHVDPRGTSGLVLQTSDSSLPGAPTGEVWGEEAMASRLSAAPFLPLPPDDHFQGCPCCPSLTRSHCRRAPADAPRDTACSVAVPHQYPKCLSDQTGPHTESGFSQCLHV